MTNADARKTAEAQAWAPDDGSDDQTWIEPRDPDDPNDSDPEEERQRELIGTIAARIGWRYEQLMIRADAEDRKAGRDPSTFLNPPTPADFRGAAVRVVALRWVRLPVESGSFERRKCCAAGKLGRACDCVKF